jgi:hypothetical protein
MPSIVQRRFEPEHNHVCCCCKVPNAELLTVPRDEDESRREISALNSLPRVIEFRRVGDATEVCKRCVASGAENMTLLYKVTHLGQRRSLMVRSVLDC